MLAALVALSLCPAAPAAGDEGAPRVSTLVNLRTGLRDGITYRHAQAVHGRGRWVLADVGYIDFGDSDGYSELWAGGGRVLHGSDRALLVVEGLLAQAFGSRSRHETYLQPWILWWTRPARRLETELVYLAYVPLDRAGTRQHVLDRFKVEVDLERFRLGVGYAGFQFGDASWEHRPFLTGTVKLRGAGGLELWLQRLEDRRGGSGFQVQLRYAITFRH